MKPEITHIDGYSPEDDIAKIRELRMEKQKGINMRLMQGDCLERMKEIEDGSVDLTVTSPPYDNLRTYNGSLDWGEHVWKPVLEDLFRVTKQGGVVVWVVGDATIKGSETGTSFKQALYAVECGFNLHDTMIYRKLNILPRDPRIPRYYQEFEYMFIFSKGKPLCNHIRQPCKHAGKKGNPYSRNNDDKLRLDRKEKNKNHVINDTKVKGNVWDYAVTKSKHPAPFPEQLAHDHIISWSNEGDTVFDPFMGSGTTGRIATINKRNFIGIEKVEDYFNIAKGRINEEN